MKYPRHLHRFNIQKVLIKYSNSIEWKKSQQQFRIPLFLNFRLSFELIIFPQPRMSTMLERNDQIPNWSDEKIILWSPLKFEMENSEFSYVFITRKNIRTQLRWAVQLRDESRHFRRQGSVESCHLRYEKIKNVHRKINVVIFRLKRIKLKAFESFFILFTPIYLFWVEKR